VTATFYWYDYETWGKDPARDRPCQFAGLRTDAELEPLGEPLVLFSRPADDLLPQPDACLVTGLTPQRVAESGLPEAEFARRIQDELLRPGTCSTGYNSLRFDEEVTRWLFYRNLLDPYAHAFRNGNSRWDLIDVLRLAHALRPEGLDWPEHEAGVPSFRLQDLTAANGIEHSGAHDALADVEATIALARRLKRAQPRLFDYALGLRSRDNVRKLLERGEPLLHVSQRYPAALGCIAPVAVVAPHPSNPNAVIGFDLRQDPELLLELSPDELRRRLFTPAEELAEGESQVPLKVIRSNASPMLAPLGTLPGHAAARWRIDPAQVERHAERAAAARAAIAERVRQIYTDGPPRSAAMDPEQMLYSGGFFSDADRAEMERLRGLGGAELADAQPAFADPRLPTLLFRMRARSWPETLDEGEREDWDAWRFERLTDPKAGASITIDAFEATLAARRTEQERAPAGAGEHERAVLDALQDWGEWVMDAG
jgi:exodeoxyribonuclease-1